jgi:hypothetical protein
VLLNIEHRGRVNLTDTFRGTSNQLHTCVLGNARKMKVVCSPETCVHTHRTKKSRISADRNFLHKNAEKIHSETNDCKTSHRIVVPATTGNFYIRLPLLFYGARHFSTPPHTQRLAISTVIDTVKWILSQTHGKTNSALGQRCFQPRNVCVLSLMMGVATSKTRRKIGFLRNTCFKIIKWCIIVGNVTDSNSNNCYY